MNFKILLNCFTQLIIFCLMATKNADVNIAEIKNTKKQFSVFISHVSVYTPVCMGQNFELHYTCKDLRISNTLFVLGFTALENIDILDTNHTIGKIRIRRIGDVYV